MTPFPETFVFGCGEYVQFEVTKYVLKPYRRPVTEWGERVTPSDMLSYRISHQFKTPCCLCATHNTTDDTRYTECAIFRSVHGEYAGEYVAGCASSSCGYQGRSY
jgi:hypothetical protein